MIQRKPKRYRGMSPFRAAWLIMPRLTGYVYAYHLKDLRELDKGKPEEEQNLEVPEDLKDDEAEEELDARDAVVYLVLETGANKISVNLAAMTVEELMYFRSFIDVAFEKALPACKARDEKALRDHYNGEYSNPRIYRALPEFVVRRRILSKYGEGIPLRLDDVLNGRLDANAFPEGTGKERVNVAQRSKGDGLTKDSGTQADQPENLEDV